MTKNTNGFTIIEIIFITILVGMSSVIFFIQKHNIEIIAQDNIKKSSINAMYYSLEEAFYAVNKYYPRSINSDNLKSVDPAVFTDPNGVMINTSGSAYSYIPTNCTDDKCKSYTLEATLENEGNYIKTNRTND
jgi:type II secretory pathway pseudopilin PulG